MLYANNLDICIQTLKTIAPTVADEALVLYWLSDYGLAKVLISPPPIKLPGRLRRFPFWV